MSLWDEFPIYKISRVDHFVVFLSKQLAQCQKVLPVSGWNCFSGTSTQRIEMPDTGSRSLFMGIRPAFSFLFNMFLLILEKRIETSVRETWLAVFCTPPPGIEPTTQVCPDRESNPWPSGSWVDAPPLRHTGLGDQHFHLICLYLNHWLRASNPFLYQTDPS